MQAIVFMDVFQMSNGTSWLVNRIVPEFMTYGGLILNTIYGGMNPRAVKTAISYGDGAKYISFGAHSTFYQASKEGRFIEGKFMPLSELYPKFKKQELDRSIRIPVDDAPGPELDEILKLIAANPHIYMITGHVSAEEGVRLVELSEEYNIDKVLVSSAVSKISSMDQLYQMADRAFIEFTLAAYTHTTSIPKTHYYIEREYASIDEGMEREPSGGLRKVVDIIKELGPERCILSTDFGVYTLPDPVEGLREFIACFLDLGIPPNDIKKLVKTNPEKLLGII
jgi:hypothetical protein